jgi:hypothetical protein
MKVGFVSSRAVGPVLGANSRGQNGEAIGFVSRGAGSQTFYEDPMKIGFVSSRAVGPVNGAEAGSRGDEILWRSCSGCESLVELLLSLMGFRSAHYVSMELLGLAWGVTRVMPRA